MLRAMEGTTLDLLGVNEKSRSDGGGDGGKRRRRWVAGGASTIASS